MKRSNKSSRQHLRTFLQISVYVALAAWPHLNDNNDDNERDHATQSTRTSKRPNKVDIPKLSLRLLDDNKKSLIVEDEEDENSPLISRRHVFNFYATIFFVEFIYKALSR